MPIDIFRDANKKQNHVKGQPYFGDIDDFNYIETFTFIFSSVLWAVIGTLFCSTHSRLVCAG